MSKYSHKYAHHGHTVDASVDSSSVGSAGFVAPTPVASAGDAGIASIRAPSFDATVRGSSG
eukprot:4430646-Alexandrium_andersonii.AAC.1